LKGDFRVSTSLVRDLNRWIDNLESFSKAMLHESQNLKVLIIDNLVNNSPSKNKAISAGRHYEDIIEKISDPIYDLKGIIDEIAGCSINEDSTTGLYNRLNDSLDSLISVINNLYDSIPAYLKGITRLEPDSPELEEQKNRMLSDFANLGQNCQDSRTATLDLKKSLADMKNLASTLKNDRII